MGHELGIESVGLGDAADRERRRDPDAEIAGDELGEDEALDRLLELPE